MTQNFKCCDSKTTILKYVADFLLISFVIKKRRGCHNSTPFVGYAVAQLVKTLCYKEKGSEFDSPWGQWDS
jgi:hypothetical protein